MTMSRVLGGCVTNVLKHLRHGTPPLRHDMALLNLDRADTLALFNHTIPASVFIDAAPFFKFVALIERFAGPQCVRAALRHDLKRMGAFHWLRGTISKKYRVASLARVWAQYFDTGRLTVRDCERELEIIVTDFEIPRHHTEFFTAFWQEALRCNATVGYVGHHEWIVRPVVQ
jgi:hypothetical protein